MDQHIVEAFKRSLIEGVQDSELPMEPSDFQKNYLSLYTGPDYKVDLKESSFKRVSALRA